MNHVRNTTRRMRGAGRYFPAAIGMSRDAASRERPATRASQPRLAQVRLASAIALRSGVAMTELATWIRESDEPLFAQFSSRHPEIRVANARRGPVDLATAGGVMITGGPDIAAQFHHEPPRDPALIFDAEPERDAWEFAAVHHAVERRLPILCICKGVQVLNVALGGTLHLDIRGHDLPEMKSANVQPLRHASGVRHVFAKVNSSHHQALDRVADALEVEAWHAGDGIIEQVRLSDYPWGVGVQYHPERDMGYASLFEDFFGQLAPSKSDHERPSTRADDSLRL